MAKAKFPKVVYVVADEVYNDGDSRMVAVGNKEELGSLMIEDTESVAIYTRSNIVRARVGEDGKITFKGGKN